MLPSPVPLVPTRTEAEIVRRIAGGGPALVAMSGGVDSSLIASFAFEALGDRSLAITLAGPAVARSEVERARRVARAVGIPHEVVEVDPLALAEYRANPSNRCYFCRSVETSALRKEGDRRGVRQYLDGVHRDDLSEERPGVRAMDEAGFDHPLVWAGWTKVEVRAAARGRGLPNWDQPSDACLSSRIAHGDPVRVELLRRIESGEAWIAARGFRRVRVRTRGNAARVEVDPEEVARLTSEPVATEVRSVLRDLGFDPVELDPNGYGAARRREGVAR
jgi:pyridinium-3,5-biscarboxylic acid mononucleotide sulfurtransferase